jgi:hypothetical protein
VNRKTIHHIQLLEVSVISFHASRGLPSWVLLRPLTAFSSPWFCGPSPSSYTFRLSQRWVWRDLSSAVWHHLVRWKATGWRDSNHVPQKRLLAFDGTENSSHFLCIPRRLASLSGPRLLVRKDVLTGMVKQPGSAEMKNGRTVRLGPTHPAS